MLLLQHVNVVGNITGYWNLTLRGLFDNIDHELLLKAVRMHTDEPWVILYIQRWLNSTVSDA